MPVYEEKQKFNAFWMSILNGFVILATLYTVYQLWGQEVDWIHFLAPFVAIVSVVLISSVTLVTKIDRDVLSVGFQPFGKRIIQRSEIAKAYVRQYSPLGEYGGWGYRTGRNGKAYNTMGDQGLQLELTDGSRVLVGTQQPRELERVIRDWLQ